MDQYLNNEVPKNRHVNFGKTVSISPDVEQALETLEKAIYTVCKYGFNCQNKSFSDLATEKPTNMEMGVVKATTSKDGVHEVPEKQDMEKNLQESRKSTGIQESSHSGSNSLRDGNHNKIAPDISNPVEANQVAVNSSANGTTEIPILDQTMHDSNQKNAEANNVHGNATIDGRRKKLSRQKMQLLCCFFINSA